MWLQLDPLNPLNHEDHLVPRSSALFFEAIIELLTGLSVSNNLAALCPLEQCWNMLERWSFGAKG